MQECTVTLQTIKNTILFLINPSLVSFLQKLACSHCICVGFFSPLGLSMHVSVEVGPLNCLQV